uniref:Glycosyltransferase RgtA/B/C/D-like domain-containing protein n=1 Tax=Ignisphaera aggregans TaxID=334771 RepID=A0A7J2T9S6_9CREN
MFIDFMLRFRVLVIALSIVVYMFLFSVASMYYESRSTAWLELVDLSFWILFVGCFLAGFTELKLFWRKSPALSSLLITVMGLGITVFARLSSTIYSLLKTSFHVQPIGGSIINDTSFILTIFIILGAFLIFASTAVNTLFREPVVFRKSPTFHEVATYLAKRFSMVRARWVLIVCFAIGFLVRLYPELKYLELPIGWDTLEYISNARDFAYQPKLLTTYIWLGGWRNLPPLLTWLSGSLAILGLDPLIFFKAYPPLVMGLISMLSATIAYRLTRSKIVALATALITLFNPYILGQSYQVQRHVLGLTLLMTYLYLCESRAKPLARASVLALCTLAYEPTALLALLLSVAEVLLEKNRKAKAVFASITVLALVMLLWYIRFPQRPVAAITPGGVYVAGNVEYDPATALNHTITCLLLLSPSIAIAWIWRSIDIRTRLTMTILFIAFLAPILCVIAPVDQPRWFLLLLTIAMPYTVASIAKLNKRVLALATLLVILLGSAYPFTETGFTHFKIFRTGPLIEYPEELAPVIKDIDKVREVANIVAKQKDLTLIGLGLYPQLHLFIRNPVNITVVYREPSLITAVGFLTTKNISRVVLITKVNIFKEVEEFSKNSDLYNVLLKIELGEKYKQVYIDIEKVSVEELYRGGGYHVYIVEVRR